MTKDTSGPTSRTPFAYYDPDSSSWKTSGVTSLWDSDESSVTWPNSGTTHAGFAFQLPTPARPIDVSESSSLPTPRASRGASGTETMYKLGAVRSNEGRTQGEVLLKTPTAQLSVNGGSQHPNKRKAGGHGPTLADEVEHLLPTPTAMDSRASGGSTPSDVTLTDLTVRTRFGATTNQRFAVGRTSSEGWPLPQPILTDDMGDIDSLHGLWSG